MTITNSVKQNQLVGWLCRPTLPSGIRRVAPVAAALASDIGNIRTENQDRAIVARGKDRNGQGYIIVVVADGIGGMKDGALCASIATGVFLSTLHNKAQLNLSTEDWLRASINAADKAVFDTYKGSGGSTLVALLFRPGKSIHWLSVGDSRIYSLVGKNLTQISTDDTIAGQLNSNEENLEHQRLLQFIGMGFELEPHIAELKDSNIQKLLLTTDGVHYLARTSSFFSQILTNAPDIGACVKRLIDVAKWCGGPDNATIAIIDFASFTEQSFELNSYSTCLELWDSFGEVQFFNQEFYQDHSYKDKIINIPSEIEVKEVKLAETVLRSAEEIKYPVVKEKKVSKNKSSPNKKPKKSSEPEVPQFNIEFSSKSK